MTVLQNMVFRVLEGYGMSECSPVISNNTPENHKKGSIGKPLENAEIRFENGEILVKGSKCYEGILSDA